MVRQSETLLKMDFIQAASHEERNSIYLKRNAEQSFKDMMNAASTSMYSQRTFARNNNRSAYDTVQNKKGTEFKRQENSIVKLRTARKSEAFAGNNVALKNIQNKGQANDKDKSVVLSTEENVIISGLAQVMNMKPDELIDLLNGAGIKLSDLVHSSKTDGVINQLSVLLDLDKDQSQTLSDVLKTVSEYAAKVSEEINSDEKFMPAGQTDGMTYDSSIVEKDSSYRGNKANYSQISVIQKEEALNLSRLINEFRTRIYEMTERRHKLPEDFTSQISEEVSQFIDAADDGFELEFLNSSTKGNLEQLWKSNAQKVDAKNEIESAMEKGGEGQNSSASGSEFSISQGNYSSNAESMAHDVSNSDNSMAYGHLTSVEAEKIDSSVQPAKVHNELSVSKSEILNQVIKNALVVISDEKSEIVMHLKPDHLGKLAMKIVTENGIVTAKFTAESQQVKELLEANMQLLKDSLEKQGLTVQGFSVSVGQDSQRRFYESRFTSSNSRTTANGRTNSQKETGIVASVFESSERLNPYRINDSLINLMA